MFAVEADQKLKIKESKMIGKYLDLAMELKKLLNMKVTVIPIIGRPLGMILKNSEKRSEQLVIGRRIDISALLRSARILRTVLETVTQTPVKTTSYENS